MATAHSESSLARLRPRQETVVWGSLLVSAEMLVLFAYLLVGGSTVLTLRGLAIWLLPFVWIDVGLWAILRTTPAPATRRRRWLAGALAVGYLGVLAYTGGLVDHSHGAFGLSVIWRTIPPGWAPTVNYGGFGLQASLVPYKVVGYLALAYLVYATILDAARSAVTGALGLLSCVSCSWPVLASLAAGVFGGGSGLAAAVYARSYLLSTVVFVATVALLYWRPFRADADA